MGGKDIKRRTTTHRSFRFSIHQKTHPDTANTQQVSILREDQKMMFHPETKKKNTEKKNKNQFLLIPLNYS